MGDFTEKGQSKRAVAIGNFFKQDTTKGLKEEHRENKF